MHLIEMPRRSLLSRYRSLPGELEDVFGMNADRRPRWAGAYTSRPPFERGADVAFHGCLGGFLPRPPGHPAEQARLGSNLGELDHTVGAVFHAIAAADAGIRDKNLAVGKTVDRVRRAILHTVWVLAMPAGCRQ